MMHDLYVVLSLYLARCFFTPFTGGYFNTAVTLGVFLNKNSNNKITSKKFAYYVIAQLIGAFIGASMSKKLYNVDAGPFESDKVYSFDDIWVRFVGETIGKLFISLGIN